MSRVDQEQVTVNLAGKDLGVWDTFSGGAAKADPTKHRPGGMGREESLGGPKSRDDFTVSRNFKLERDLPIAAFIDEQVGVGKVVVVRTMLGTDKVPVGEQLTYTGTLTGAPFGDHDSDAADPKFIMLEVSADEPIR